MLAGLGLGNHTVHCCMQPLQQASTTVCLQSSGKPNAYCILALIHWEMTCQAVPTPSELKLRRKYWLGLEPKTSAQEPSMTRFEADVNPTNLLHDDLHIMLSAKAQTRLTFRA